ncbi:hypothetical protein DdX_12096 [Ditylenchus destructor]|uniref:Uncharacterized protein n=1 Tax=Ditylenchus destructor TaxID=166010 RepID=A0AAD4R432_9BILA|nr:hypothetical protein DdX_12096 [Ditylenchus destructor]
MKRCLARSSTPLPSISGYNPLKALRMTSNTTSSTSEESPESSDSESRPKPPRKLERKSGMSLAAMNTVVTAKMRALDESNDAIHAKKVELDKVLQKYKKRITQPCSKCKRMRKELENAEDSKLAMQEELMQYRYAVAAKKFKMVAKTDASCQSTFKDPELDAANAENLRLQEKLDNQFKQYDSHIWSMDAELQRLNRVKSNLDAQLAKYKHTGNDANQTPTVTANASIQTDLDTPETRALPDQDSKLQAELVELRAQNEQLNAVISSMKKKNISLEDDLAIQRGKAERRINYIEDQTAKTNALKEELDKLKADSSAEKSALVEEIAKMKAEMASIQQEHSSLKSKILNSKTEQGKYKAVSNSGNAPETITKDSGSQSKLNGSKLDAVFAVKTALESELARSRAQLSSVTSDLSSALKNKSSLESQLASHKTRQTNRSDKETQYVAEHNDQGTQTPRKGHFRSSLIDAYSQVDIDDVLELRSEATAVMFADLEPVNVLVPVSPEPLSPCPSLRISVSETSTPMSKDNTTRELSPVRSTPQSPLSSPEEKVPEFSAITTTNYSRAKSVPPKPKLTKRKVVLTDPRLARNPSQTTLKDAQKPISAVEVRKFEQSKNPVEKSMPEFLFNAKQSVHQNTPSMTMHSGDTIENRKNEIPAGATSSTSTNLPVKRPRIVYNGDVPESTDRPLKQQKSDQISHEATRNIESFLDWGRPRRKMDQVVNESEAISSLEEISSIHARVTHNTKTVAGLDNPQTLERGQNSRRHTVEIPTKSSGETSSRRPRIVYNTNPDVKIGQSKKDVQKSEQNSNNECSSSGFTSSSYSFGSSESKILSAEGKPWINSSIASNIRFTPTPYNRRTSQSSCSAEITKCPL